MKIPKRQWIDLERFWFTRLLNLTSQVINVLVFFGYADEMVSARCWRQRKHWFWGRFRWTVDTVVFWQKNHCFEAWVWEQEERDSHPAYRDEYKTGDQD